MNERMNKLMIDINSRLSVFSPCHATSLKVLFSSWDGSRYEINKITKFKKRKKQYFRIGQNKQTEEKELTEGTRITHSFAHSRVP